MTLKPIPLNFLTLYADLAQNARSSTRAYGSVVVRKRGGREYLYVVSKAGAQRSEAYLGPASDPLVAENAEEIRHAAKQARSLRTSVSALKQARIPAPSMKLGRVLEVVANAGLFDRGVVLIGTAAFQTYACALGYYLPGAAIMTNDADLLVASFVAGDDKLDMERILRQADPTFRAIMGVNDRLPKVFKSSDTFSVDILTKYGRGRKSPLLIESLGCSAEALTFMEYLSEESVETVVLYGAGVVVRVPPPLRYAIHKLLVAQKRHGKFSAKKPKDLMQARDLLDILMETDLASVSEGLDEARGRGPAWKSAINASLKELGRDTRPDRLPFPIESRDKSEHSKDKGSA